MRAHGERRPVVLLLYAVGAAGLLAHLIIGASDVWRVIVLAMLWGAWNVAMLGLGLVNWMARRGDRWLRYLVLGTVGSVGLIALFLLPPVGHEFRYALPYGDLPPKIDLAGRVYDQSSGCASAHDVVALPGDHVAQIGALWAFLGAAKPIVTTSTAAAPGNTATVVFVHVGGCYQPYELEGGP